jgi:hypothetical protein
MTSASVRLGELLLQQQLCSRDALKQAWDAKVAYGDRLGTNLLSLGVLSEAVLAGALSLQQGVPVADLAPMQVSWVQGVLAVLPREVLVRERVFPTGVSAAGAVIFACVDPLQASWAAAVAPLLRGRGVEATILCEARMWDLQERFLHHRPSMRRNPLRMVTPVPSRPAVRQERPAPEQDGPGPELTSELTSEEDFRSLYGNLHQRDSGPRPSLGEAFATPADDAVPFAAVSAPAIVGAVDPLVLSAPMEELALRDEPVEDPLSHPEARAMIAAANHRDDVAVALLRAARSRFARAAMVMLHPDRVLGWMGLGEGMAHLSGFALPRSQPSVFQLVAESRAHFVGALSRQVAHGTWVKATGKRIPLSIAALPVLLRGEVVHILVVDNGHQQHIEASDLTELLLLAQDAANRYEELLTAAG